MLSGLNFLIPQLLMASIGSTWGAVLFFFSGVVADVVWLACMAPSQKIRSAMMHQPLPTYDSMSALLLIVFH